MTESSPQATPPQESAPPQDVTPPRQPGEIGGTELQARWPKIIGIISIVLGAGGCLGAAWGFFMPIILEMMAEYLPPNQAAAFGEVEALGNRIVISSILTLAIGLVLLVAGIALVKRRRYGIKLARIWAVSKMLFVLVRTFVGYTVQQEQFEQMTQQMSQQNPLLRGGAVLDTAMIVGFAVGLTWSCAYPVFLLIWFSRGKVKAEYAEWS